MRWRGVLAVLICALAPLASAVADNAPAKPGLEIILTSAAADTAKLGPLVDCVAVTPDGVAVVGDGDRLWSVGAEGARTVGAIRNLRSFAFVPGGMLIGVRGRNLVYLDPYGSLKTLVGLPALGMNVAPGHGETLLLFGPEGKGGYGLYLVQPGRHLTKLLRSPKPITDAAQAGSRVLFISDGALYGVSGDKLRLIAGEPGGALTSVAVDDAGGRIFVSDGKRVFQIQEGGAVPIVGDMGGTVRWYGGGLLVLDAQHRALVRLVGLPF